LPTSSAELMRERSASLVLGGLGFSSRKRAVN
jgi:hypothetical protein